VAESASIFIAESLWGSAAESPSVWEPCEGLTVSTDRLLEVPLREVRRRFRDEMSPSSKGFGRVEQGSEETARSLDSSVVGA
jgi:hypothetical protein